MKKYWWFETKWHQKMVKALQVSGKGERTQEAYVRAMRMLVEHYDKTPDKITEDELQDYFIHRQNVTKWAPATLRICYTGIKFFFMHVLKKDWHLLTILKTKHEKRLPAVLSKEEVRRVFSCITTFHLIVLEEYIRIFLYHSIYCHKGIRSCRKSAKLVL